MPVLNRVPVLLAEKFGSEDKIVVQRIAQDLRLTYSTVERWVKNDVTRADFPILEKWCEYLECDIGDILIYIPGDKSDDAR